METKPAPERAMGPEKKSEEAPQTLLEQREGKWNAAKGGARRKQVEEESHNGKSHIMEKYLNKLYRLSN